MGPNSLIRLVLLYIIMTIYYRRWIMRFHSRSQMSSFAIEYSINLTISCVNQRNMTSFDREIINNHAAQILMPIIYKSTWTKLLLMKNNSHLINSMNYRVYWLNTVGILMGLLCLLAPKGPQCPNPSLGPGVSLHISCSLYSWATIQKRTSTHGWYWLPWWMWHLWMVFTWLHCFQKEWPSQTNLWPLPSQLMS